MKRGLFSQSNLCRWQLTNWSTPGKCSSVPESPSLAQNPPLLTTAHFQPPLSIHLTRGAPLIYFVYLPPVNETGNTSPPPTKFSSFASYFSWCVVLFFCSINLSLECFEGDTCSWGVSGPNVFCAFCLLRFMLSFLCNDFG
ncbi:hypothetical protein JTE90_024448 [Oedothorax gibbosus]|uniref:Uncharacterized protein n=1 Tax=Oedothorax gibbosus TaxID=931172 RepID=A0AAV6U9D1_9ARAC|nr:hypothetical protein JTE90_024448 [Oedothorax gibbosus]